MTVKPLTPEFAHALWREMKGEGMLDTSTGVYNLPAFKQYRFNGNPTTDHVLLESDACKAVAEQAWTALTQNGMASRGVALVIIKVALVAAMRFGMYAQRRAIERSELL
jgi:hypothetical protein